MQKGARRRDEHGRAISSVAMLGGRGAGQVEKVSGGDSEEDDRWGR